MRRDWSREDQAGGCGSFQGRDDCGLHRGGQWQWGKMVREFMSSGAFLWSSHVAPGTVPGTEDAAANITDRNPWPRGACHLDRRHRQMSK